jgi:hypothetical protein
MNSHNNQREARPGWQWGLDTEKSAQSIRHALTCQIRVALICREKLLCSWRRFRSFPMRSHTRLTSRAGFGTETSRYLLAYKLLAGSEADKLTARNVVEFRVVTFRGKRFGHAMV